MTTHTNGEATARLLFIVFAHVADCGKRIEPQDIEQLNQLLVDTGWTRNSYLRAGLESLRDGYSALWADYESGKLVASLEAARLRMAVAMIGMKPEQGAVFKQGLLEFTRRALPVGPGALSMLGLSGSAERRRARKEVDELLSTGPDAVAPASSAGAAAAREPARTPASTAAAPAGAAASPGTGVRTGAAPASGAAAGADASSAAPARAPQPDAPATDWTGGRIQAVCARVTEETHDTKTYTFVAEPARLFKYRPGQFVTVELPIDGAVCKRSYTLSSSPSRPHALSITVKRVPGGLASNWLYDNMQPGMSLPIKGPYGTFSCLEHPARKLLLVSGGSGVTPMISMLRWFADTAAETDIVFINNVRTPADVIFEQELAYLGTRLGAALKVAVIPGAHAPSRPWNGLLGRLDRTMLLALAPDFMERETFVCGPAPYMDVVQAMLRELGYPMQRFHMESFGGPTVAPAQPSAPAGATAPPPRAAGTAPALRMPPAATSVPAPAPMEVAPAAPPMPPRRLPAPAPAPAVAPAPGVIVAAGYAPALSLVVPARAAAAARLQIVFEGRGQTVDCEDDETVLEAAERCNVVLEASCRSGRCGTCRVKKVSGEVVMDGQEALTEADLESGYVLACVARPKGRVVLQA